MEALVVLGCVSVLAIDAAAQVPIGTGTVDAVGTAAIPWNVWLADVDGDGDLDVVTASAADNEINWFDNDGARPPTFTPRTVIAGPDFATTVASGDIDGDGDMDLVGGSSGDSTIAWYENDGASPPAFNQRLVDVALNVPRSVLAADVDGDGDTDLVAGSETQGVFWYENDGLVPPTFTRRAVPSGVNGVTAVGVGDIDGDGDLDITSSNEFDDEIAWHENLGGTPLAFTRHVASDAPDVSLWHTVSDLDGDGDLDIAVASILDGAVSWLENVGTPTGWPHRILTLDGFGMRGVHAGDIDGDGDVDLAGAAEFDDEVYLFVNGGGSPPSFDVQLLDSTLDGASSVRVGDLDGDGDGDVVAVGFNSTEIRYYANETTRSGARLGDATLLLPVVTGASGLAADDLDRDGDPDLASTAAVSADVSIHTQLGSDPLVFASSVVESAAPGASEVVAVDLDRDGDVDLAATSSVDDTLAWFESDGASPPGFTRRVVSTSIDGAEDVVSADVNGDGRPDLVAAGSLDATVRLYENAGGSPLAFTVTTVSAVEAGVLDVAVGDFDDDGDLDLASAAYDAQRIAWHRNDGGTPTVFTTTVLSGARAGASAVVAADVDRDGDLDLVAASELDGTLVWYENAGGAASFTERTLSTSLAGVARIATADLDNDGDLDVVAASPTGDVVTFFENDGGSPPTFVRAPIDGFADGVEALAVVDLDRDGRMDVAAAEGIGDQVVAFLNTGGQISVAASGAGESALAQGGPREVLRLVVGHEGQVPDAAIRLETLGFRFETIDGLALSSAALANLVAGVDLYADDGSESFESGTDTLLVAAAPALDGSGELVLALPGAAPETLLAAGTSRVYWLVLPVQADAASQTPSTLRLVALGDAAAAARDESSGLAVRFSALGAVTTPPLQAVVAGAPMVALTSPVDGATFSDPPSVGFTAVASSADSSIERVEFLVDGGVVATDATSPYEASWVPTGGPHSIVARAFDADQDSTDSDPVSITITLPDADGDGVPDVSDSAPLDPNACGQDGDADLCDDCASGMLDPANDGPDLDADGICDASDPHTGWVRTITVGDGNNSEDLLDFPVLVRLDATRIDYAKASPDGSDLLFVDSTGAAVPFEIERWDATGDSWIWVRVPVVPAAGTTTLDMYYGDGNFGASQAPEQVWSAGYRGVWHLNDDLTDASPETNDGTNLGATTTPGWIADGRYFDGGDAIDLGSDVSLNLLGAATLEAWILADPSHPVSGRVLSKKAEWNAPGGYNLEVNAPAGTVTSIGSGSDFARADGVGFAGQWQHLAVSIEGGSAVVYVDGVDVTTDATLAPIALAGESLVLGRKASGGDFFLGAIDEVRVSDVARSPSWIGAQYAAMTDAGFIVVGAERTAADAPSVTLTSPTDGAVVALPADVTLAATATSLFSSVDRVEFFVDGGLVGTDDTAPYSVVWPATFGPHTITATGYDLEDDAGNAAPISIDVTADDGDGDGVPDFLDAFPADPNACGVDVDADSCDDCTSGTQDPLADGPDLDADGLCDAGDGDIDGDGVANASDTSPTDGTVCGLDVDTDGCDDCTSGTADPASDGPDFDGDGICDASDPREGSRRSLTLDTSTRPESLVDVPVLVRLDATRIDYAQTLAGGTDVYFTDANDNLLSHEIEVWNPSGESVLWVKVPALPAGASDTLVWMYYGDPALTSDRQDAPGVWTNGYAGVWHLGADTADSTGNGNDGVNEGSTSGAGVFGLGRDFDGAAAIQIASSSSLEFFGAVTLSAWARVDDPASASAQRVLSKKQAWNSPAGFNLELNAAGDSVTTLGSGSDFATGVGVGGDTDWHHLAATLDGPTGAIYVDGVETTTDATVTPLIPDGQALTFGRRSGGGGFLEGSLDEIRISSVARTASWLAVQTDSMADVLISYGAEEEASPRASVTLSAPVDGQAFVGPLNVAIAADATPGLTPVVRVDFYADGTPIGTDFDAPYGIDWLAPVGNHVLTAEVEDAAGLLSTSPVVTISVSLDPALDADGDGVADGSDAAPLDPNVCSDVDADGCDDCALGAFDPANDGPDADGNGVCDVTDPDDDGDGVLDGSDNAPRNASFCADADGDLCDDCSGGAPDPSADGPDFDGDGICDLSDPRPGLRRLLTLDTTGIATAQPDVPVLVRLDPTRIDYTQTLAGGTDVGFSDLDGNALAHEVERWTPGGESILWVRVPLVAANGATAIYMYYGDPGATTDTQDAASTWSNGYVGVWHLGADLDDSTAFGHAGVDAGTATAAGAIGDGRDFDGGDFVDVGTSAALEVTGELTAMAWVRFDDPTASGAQRIVSKKADWNSTSGYNLEYAGEAGLVTALSSGSDFARGGSGSLDASWHLVGSVVSGAAGRIWIDGVDATTDSTVTPLAASDQSLVFGRRSGGGDFLTGGLDEVRIANVARSDDWMRLQYRSMSDALIAYGPEEPASPLAAVAIFAPNSGQTLQGPLNVAVQAFAGSAVTTIDQVEFFADGLSIGVDFTAPWETSWTAPVGSHVLTAVADDGLGGQTTSAGVALTIDLDPAQDADGDGVSDDDDAAPGDPNVCSDVDGDLCDDCSGGSFDPANDGVDFDGDGLCDLGDPDQDGDGVPNASDPAPLDATTCGDSDADTCDDCAGGVFDPANDGPDLDRDGLCDAGDPRLGFRRALSFDNAAQSETLADFPVPVVLDATRIDYATTLPGGTDLLFTDAAGNLLAHEIEVWDPAGESIVWVRVPSISGGSTNDFIWMYYGDPTGTNDLQDANGVWSNGYAAVWHLDGLTDSTVNANTGTNLGTSVTPGLLGNARAFDGASAIDAGTSPSLELAGTGTLAAWVRVNDPASTSAQRIVSKKQQWNTPAGYNLELDAGGATLTSIGSGSDFLRGATGPVGTTWHYVVATFDGGAGHVYWDGVDQTTDGTLATIAPDAQGLVLGRRSGGGDFLDGALDEVRLSTVERSADWIAAQFDAMLDAFVSFGPEESL